MPARYCYSYTKLTKKHWEKGIHLCSILPSPCTSQAHRGGPGVQVEDGPGPEEEGTLGWMDGRVSPEASFVLSPHEFFWATSGLEVTSAVSLGLNY